MAERSMPIDARYRQDHRHRPVCVNSASRLLLESVIEW